MRIAFDGTALQPQRTGVGYYTEHLLRHLTEEASTDEIVVVSNGPIDTTAALPAGVRVARTASRLPRLAWTQFRAPHALRELGADVAHFTNGMMPVASPVPTVVTIHDMSLTLYPRYHPARRVLLNRPLVAFAARHATAIITVSASAKRDIVRLCRIPPERVHVVHEAAAPAFRPVRDRETLDRVRRRYGLAERVILYVGTIEPRKNLRRLVEAFASRLRAGDLSHQLVCVGPYGWLSRDIHSLIDRLGVSHAVTFTGYVPFAELPAFYSLAEMFVFPSLHEGFGLPIIEAMACGTPVITGHTSSMPEVAGDAVEHVDAIDTVALGDAMVRLARSREQRDRLSVVGRERADRFSWRRAARETLAVYRLAAQSAASPASASPAPAAIHISPRATAHMAHAAEPADRLSAAAQRREKPAASTVDVLFGQAYYLRFDPKLWAARQPYAPLGALYAAAVVRDRRYNVALFDAMLAASEAEWASALDAHRPRFAVIYEDNFNYLTKMCLLRMRQAALAMIDEAKARGVATIVAGSDATDHPQIYLARGADVVIIGEGEKTLVEAIDVIAGRARGPLDAVPGLCIRGRAGLALRTGPRDVIRNLDALPLPAWDLIDVERYRRIWRRRHGMFSMNLVTTRGCPYHCNWCAKPLYGQRYSIRSPERVVDEMAWLKRTHRPDHLWIADDIFGLKPGWIERFAELVTAHDAAVPFKCLMRADQITPAVAGALRAARCRTVWLGAESGSQRILDAMEKGISAPQIHEATRLLRAAGIEIGFFLQFGYPGETRADVDLTLQMVRDCRPDDIGVSVSYPLPGTRFYERVKDQLGRKQNWVDSDDLAMMYRATYIPEFYRALHALVHNQFRSRKILDELRQAFSRPTELRPQHLRRAVSLAWHVLKRPVLQLRVDRLERTSPPQLTTVPLAVLTPQAAGVPSEQSNAAAS
jgi:anaerobic magnesium-protoporphyrin IX monomethyl ester cyclase